MNLAMGAAEGRRGEKPRGQPSRALAWTAGIIDAPEQTAEVLCSSVSVQDI